MMYQFTGLFYPSVISGFIALWLVFILWKFKKVDGVKYLICFEISAAIWAICDGFEHASLSLVGKQLWSQISYIGITPSAPFFLLFALEYTQNYKFINRRSLGLLFVIPFITLLLVFTNPFHHLIWNNIELIKEENLSVYYYGSWFWIFISFTYITLSSGILILLLSILRFYSSYKNQALLLIFSVLFPFIGNILYIFKLSPVKAIDFTPISFIISGILVSISVYWLRIFEIIPIARKKIIDNLSDGVIVLDMANRIIEANPAFYKILGMQQEMIIGTSFETLSKKIFSGRIIKDSANEFIDEICINEAMNPRYFEVKVNMVTDRKNHIGKVILLNDITSRKNTLKQLEESNQELVQEIKEKEKLIKDLDAYARSVAHDLKSPISGMIGLTELVKMDYQNNNPQQAIELLNLMQNQGYKMCKIVDELLLLSRIRKNDVIPEELNMNKIISEALLRINPLIEKNQAVIEYPNQWPLVKGQAQWIEEIWVNLVSNAIKYGGTPPRVLLGFEPVNETTYRFYVSDNGNGLPSKSMDLVFRDFERLDKINIEGHGLGLPIVKRIIEKLGGIVEVQSTNTPGEGCTFSFTLSV